jgi:hypothetical protein
MLSAMVADVVSGEFLGTARFLSGFPSGIALHHARNYLLIALLAVVAALLGLAFKNVRYKTEVTVGQSSPAAGQPLGETIWPQGWVPLSVLHDHALRDPDPVVTLAPGDRVNLLVPAPPRPGPRVPHDEPVTQPGLSQPEAPTAPPDERQ